MESIVDYKSSSYRYEKEIRGIDMLLYSELAKYFMDEKNIIEFNFLARYLSLVRDQGYTGSWSYVHAVACTEMLYRIWSREVHNLAGRFYFDVVDCFDHLYWKFPNLPKATEKLHHTMGLSGTRVCYVLSYIRKTNSACTNPHERNLAAEFIETPTRNKLNWFEKLERDEVLPLLRKFPIIAVLKSYKSFKHCPVVVYTGPTEGEILDEANLDRSHTVLLVGSFRTKTENGESRQYVIAQNSYGTKYGFKGYVMIPFDTPRLLLEFWLPMLSPEMDYLKKKHKPSPQTVGSKRRRLDNAI